MVILLERRGSMWRDGEQERVKEGVLEEVAPKGRMRKMRDLYRVDLPGKHFWSTFSWRGALIGRSVSRKAVEQDGTLGIREHTRLLSFPRFILHSESVPWRPFVLFICLDTHSRCATASRYTEMQVTREDLRKARVPLNRRDYCAHLYIDLEKCRQQTYRMPWKCEGEQHNYDYCIYME